VILPDPFWVLATQNPVEHEGTYPLPEAQLDRFLMKLHVDYPDRSAELAMLDLADLGPVALGGPEPPPILGPADIRALRLVAASVRVAPSIKEYAVDLVRATRDPAGFGLDLAPLIELGASPRASLALVASARAHALLAGRDFVTPHDVKTLARDVLRHRVLASYEADAEGVTPDDLIGRILDQIRVP
jgi:MoxR-like ATPase